MFVISILPKNDAELVSDFAKAKVHADLVEIRLDHLLDNELLKRCAREASCIFTFPKVVNEEEILNVASLSPKWLMLDSKTDPALFSSLRKRYPEVGLIASFHDHEKTPDSLEAIAESLSHLDVSMIKIVTYARSSLDSLRMLSFLKASLRPLIAFCMGEKGTFSRLLAPIFGSKMTFSSLDHKPTAPGQLSFTESYHLRSLNCETKLYGLVGSPVSHSLSHKTHNAFFQKLGVNALYVKMDIEKEEFDAAFPLIEALGFSGLSVTRPLKDAFGSPINTIRFSRDGPAFLNSDGLGMLEAIGEVFGKKMLILGAGATGYAIAKEALKRGAEVFIANRTASRAEKVAQELGCNAVSWQFTHPYDILVNATNVELDVETLHPGAIVADVIWPKKTRLLEKAERSGHRIVTGFEMWKNQALHQFRFWFPEKTEILEQVWQVIALGTIFE